MLLSLATATHAGLGHEIVAASGNDHAGTRKSAEPEPLLQELESFNAAPVSLHDALVVALRHRPGARAVTVNFEGTAGPAVYRVQTSRGDHIWQDAVDAYTGTVVGAGMETSVADLEQEDRRLLVRLGAVRQEIADAVIVAERNTSGKAISAGLAMDEGRLQFVIFCIAGSDLKQVLLEPPTASAVPRR